MLVVTNLKKSYASPEGGARVLIVEIPAFSLKKGEMAALLGSSGSGKTTFLHLLAGILVADVGRVEYTLPQVAAGVDIMALSEPERDHFRGQHIGLIFQQHHLLPGLTAMENVLLGMSFTGRKPDKTWAAHLLERIGLADRLAYKPGKLSVGQQQRVAVARALANRPQVVLADEPTGALDARAAEQTLGLMTGLCAEIGAGLLMVTHDVGLAAKLPSQINLGNLNRAAGGAEVI